MMHFLLLSPSRYSLESSQSLLLLEKLNVWASELVGCATQCRENAGMKRCFYVTVLLLYYESTAVPGGKRRVFQSGECSLGKKTKCPWKYLLGCITCAHGCQQLGMEQQQRNRTDFKIEKCKSAVVLCQGSMIKMPNCTPSCSREECRQTHKVWTILWGTEELPSWNRLVLLSRLKPGSRADLLQMLQKKAKKPLWKTKTSRKTLRR